MNIVVYTVILNGYDRLAATEWPSVCLTDGSVKPARGWMLVTNWDYSGDPRTASRRGKILAHKMFPKTEYTIYVDGNIDLLIKPSIIINTWLKKHDIAVSKHPQRDCVYREAKACIEYGKGNPEIIQAQMQQYRKEGYPLRFGLAACYVLVRRLSKTSIRFNEAWWNEFVKYPARDQLSFDYVRWKAGIGYDVIGGNILKNKSKHFRRRKHK